MLSIWQDVQSRDWTRLSGSVTINHHGCTIHSPWGRAGRAESSFPWLLLLSCLSQAQTETSAYSSGETVKLNSVSIVSNTLSSGSLLISFILWIMREEAESEFWKLPHPLVSPGEHGNTSHFAQLPFVVGCLIFHLSFASLVCCWASGSAISKSFPRMKEKFTCTLFCVLIPFPRNLPSKPKGLGKIFRE